MNHFEEKTRKIEEIMTDFIDFLKTFEYKEDFMNDINIADGRIISAVGETAFVVPIINDWIKQSKIVEKYKITAIIPEIRKMYDVMFKSESDDAIIIPCNIKISSFKSPDNLNCQNVLDLVSSGNIPSKMVYSKDEVYANVLKIKREKLFNEPIDFYFICVNKTDMTSTFYTSLLTIKDFTLNASNLLQCNWAKVLKAGRTCLYEPTKDDIKSDEDRGLVPRLYRSYKDSISNVINAYNLCYNMRDEQTKKAKTILKEQLYNAKKTSHKI